MTADLAPGISPGTNILIRARELRAEGRDDDADALVEEYTKKLERKTAAAEEQARVADEQARLERARAERAEAKADRKRRTHTPKPLLPPSEDPMLPKILGEKGMRAIDSEMLHAAAHLVVGKRGPADWGPPPDGLDGVPQKGSRGVPSLTVLHWFEQFGAEKTSQKVERKVDNLALKAREDAVRVFRVLIFVDLVARFDGDMARAHAEFANYELASFDPEAVEVGVAHDDGYDNNERDDASSNGHGRNECMETITTDAEASTDG